VLVFERLQFEAFPWEKTHLGLPGQTLFQSAAWLNFLKATQKGEPVLAELRQQGSVAGYFTGMIVRKFGLRILGSPFPGWSTSYMGLNLQPGVCKLSALDALKRFAFQELGCAHLEFMDRTFSHQDIAQCGLRWTPLNGFEVDLTADEELVFGRFHPSCRRAVRKALRSGVSVEEANDVLFVDEYYAQLHEVFARQKLVPTYDKTRVEELVRHIQPTGKLLLLRARDRERRSIATGIFLLISPTTVYFWGGASWCSYQHLRPNDLLMWSAMRISKLRGMKIMDLGGAGDYKKKFGGSPISVPWARISSQPFIALLRETAKTVFSLRQRITYRTASARSTDHVEIPSCSCL
jgi:hypothetical protein